MYCNVCNKQEIKKKLKRHIFLKTHYVFLSFTVSVVMNIKKYLRKKNPLKYQKFLV